uniref:Transposase n=1 Tax=Acrobeloides nanus TaxID=290746 RepID=A0A914EC06_9BILA
MKEFRDAIIRMHEHGTGKREIGRLLGIDDSTVRDSTDPSPSHSAATGMPRSWLRDYPALYSASLLLFQPLDLFQIWFQLLVLFRSAAYKVELEPIQSIVNEFLVATGPVPANGHVTATGPVPALVPATGPVPPLVTAPETVPALVLVTGSVPDLIPAIRPFPALVTAPGTEL